MKNLNLKKYVVFFILILIVMLAIVLLKREAILVHEKANSYKPKGKIITQNKDDFGELVYKENFRLSNNVWNKKNAYGEKYQRIFIETIDGKQKVGWDWNWRSNKGVVSYPEIIFGDKPWEEPKGLRKEFPQKALSKNLHVKYDYVISANGVYNMALSMWLINGNKIKKEAISHEIMIWVKNSGLNPAGQLFDVCKLDGIEYNVYLEKFQKDNSDNNNETWKYIAFVRNDETNKIDLNTKTFLQYLYKKDIVAKDNYLASVEIGNEIQEGAGIVEIENLSIDFE